MAMGRGIEELGIGRQREKNIHVTCYSHDHDSSDHVLAGRLCCVQSMFDLLSMRAAGGLHYSPYTLVTLARQNCC